MRVSEIMATDPITVSDDATVSRAAQLMDEQGIRHLPVVRDALLVGVLSDRDLYAATGWLVPRVDDELELAATVVRDVMHAPPWTVEPEATLRRAVELMEELGVGCLPVTRSGALLGLLTATDLLELFVGSSRYGRLAGDDPSVETAMTPTPETIGPETPFAEVARILKGASYRHLPVVRNDRPVGIVSDRDVRSALGRGEREDAPVANWMTAKVDTLRVGEPLSEAARRLAWKGIGALPVVDDAGRLVGVLSVVDVLARCRGLFDEPADSETGPEDKAAARLPE